MLRLYAADAYSEGYRAFQEGKSLSANPYQGKLDRNESEWRVGWRSAKANQNERKAA